MRVPVLPACVFYLLIWKVGDGYSSLLDIKRIFRESYDEKEHEQQNNDCKGVIRLFESTPDNGLPTVKGWKTAGIQSRQ
jgi:hypothetical protein